MPIWSHVQRPGPKGSQIVNSAITRYWRAVIKVRRLSDTVADISMGSAVRGTFRSHRRHWCAACLSFADGMGKDAVAGARCHLFQHWYNAFVTAQQQPRNVLHQNPPAGTKPGLQKSLGAGHPWSIVETHRNVCSDEASAPVGGLDRCGADVWRGDGPSLIAAKSGSWNSSVAANHSNLRPFYPGCSIL